MHSDLKLQACLLYDAVEKRNLDLSMSNHIHAYIYMYIYYMYLYPHPINSRLSISILLREAFHQMSADFRQHRQLPIGRSNHAIGSAKGCIDCISSQTSGKARLVTLAWWDGRNDPNPSFFSLMHLHFHARLGFLHDIVKISQILILSDMIQSSLSRMELWIL